MLCSFTHYPVNGRPVIFRGDVVEGMKVQENSQYGSVVKPGYIAWGPVNYSVDEFRNLLINRKRVQQAEPEEE